MEEHTKKKGDFDAETLQLLEQAIGAVKSESPTERRIAKVKAEPKTTVVHRKLTRRE